jgi:MFS family permease
MKIFTELFFNKELLEIRVLVIVAVLSSLLNLVYNSLYFSLQLSFAQNFLVPLVCTVLFLRHQKSSSAVRDFRTNLKSGIKIGVVVGTITILSSTITNEIYYYFLGGREEVSKFLGIPFLSVTFGSLLINQIFYFSFSLFWVSISAIAGIIGTALTKFSDRSRKEHY